MSARLRNRVVTKGGRVAQVAGMPFKIDLPEFQKAMNAHPEMTSPFSHMTMWRYGSGQFPDAVYWLMLEPDLLEALARDARELSPDVVERMREEVFGLKVKEGPERRGRPPGKAGRKKKDK